MAQEVYTLTLDKQIKGTGGPMIITICTTVLDGDEMDCFLTTIDLKGSPTAEGLEIALKESNTTFIGNQTWTLKKKRTVIVEDEDENESSIVLDQLVVKVFDGLSPSAKATIGSGGKGTVVELATENWTESE